MSYREKANARFRSESWRINLVLVFIVFFGLAIIGRLFFIQIVRGDYYRALSQGLYVTDGQELSPRGEIFFKNEEPLAINIDWQYVFASPSQIEDKNATADILSSLIGVDKQEMLSMFMENETFVVLKKRLSEEEISKINEASLKGIYLKKESGRYYPQETLASKIAGFLDPDRKGQYGLEEYYDEVLRGKKDVPGKDIILTIDYSIQFKAEQLLKDAKNKLDFESAQAVVMEASTGKILAMASYPNFNPNKYSEVESFDLFQNAVTQKIFEPGSVFKPITMGAAINEGKISPQTTYRDSGEIKIGGYKIYNYGMKQYPGDLTMTNALEKSINTGVVFAEQQLGNVLFSNYVEKLGVFEPTKIDLDEAYSENREFKKGYEINYVTAAFGQGIEMTPIQLMRAYSAIVNGGKLVRPYLVEKIKGIDGVEEIQPEIEEIPIFSQKTLSSLAAMMVSVVENGYAKSAKISGYYVAGKTGTAQVAWSSININQRGYSDKTWQSFIGFAPAFNPRFLILVKLDNPATQTAEYSAVPIFHDLAKYIVDYWQIPPDFDSSVK